MQLARQAMLRRKQQWPLQWGRKQHRGHAKRSTQSRLGQLYMRISANNSKEEQPQARWHDGGTVQA